MNTLERLKELEQSGDKRPDETHGEYYDRWNFENSWMRARLHYLLAVVEAARAVKHVENRQGFELDLADLARAKDNLDAALAKLEGGAE